MFCSFLNGFGYSVGQVCVCICVWSSLSADCASTGYGCQYCLWSAEQGKRSFPWPCWRLRVWSRKLGSVVPAGVNPLMFHTQPGFGAYVRDYIPPSRFSLRFPLEPPCAIRLVPSLSGHVHALPVAFTTENPQGPVVLKVAR